MGIGAYECREYVRELRGELNVTSSVGQGTIFTVNLPQPQSVTQEEVEHAPHLGVRGG